MFCMQTLTGHEMVASRHFRNKLPEHFPGAIPLIEAPRMLSHLRKSLEFVISSPDSREFRRPSAYTGRSGIAYTLHHVLRVPEVVSQLPNAPDLARTGAELAFSALHQHYAQPSGVPWSLIFGEAGAHAVAALCAKTAANLGSGDQADMHAEAERQLRQFEKHAAVAASAACHEDEFLYGRAGFLMGALQLDQGFGESGEGGRMIHNGTVERVAAAILQSGHRQAKEKREAEGGCDSPLWWQWHGADYLGAAHGSMGILYTLLHVPAPILDAIPHSMIRIKGALDYVLSLEVDSQGHPAACGFWPTRMGPFRDKEPLCHWCHGAPGAVFLFSQAYTVLGEQRFLEAAERAGEVVWARGLLRKGPGACHGISGNAYALLRLYKTTKDDKWLHRALQFAEFMQSEEFQRGARTPDHPRSLFEGQAAAACLYADLLRPSGAAFPLFELESSAA